MRAECACAVLAGVLVGKGGERGELRERPGGLAEQGLEVSDVTDDAEEVAEALVKLGGDELLGGVRLWPARVGAEEEGEGGAAGLAVEQIVEADAEDAGAAVELDGGEVGAAVLGGAEGGFAQGGEAGEQGAARSPAASRAARRVAPGVGMWRWRARHGRSAGPGVRWRADPRSVRSGEQHDRDPWRAWIEPAGASRQRPHWRASLPDRAGRRWRTRWSRCRSPA